MSIRSGLHHSPVVPVVRYSVARAYSSPATVVPAGMSQPGHPVAAVAAGLAPAVVMAAVVRLDPAVAVAEAAVTAAAVRLDPAVVAAEAAVMVVAACLGPVGVVEEAAVMVVAAGLGPAVVGVMAVAVGLGLG